MIVTDDIGEKEEVKTELVVEQQEPNVERTHEEYLAEKEAAKEERKKAIQLKIACDKDPNPQGEVSKECTELIDEKDWNDIDKDSEEENKSDEKDSNGTSDSSSDNN